MRGERCAVVALALVGFACGRPAGDEPSTLTILYPGDERIFSPYWEMPAKFLVFEPLVTHDEHGELVGALARHWEHSPDYRTWTIRLRSDVRWHDGQPFTARDVAFTYELMSHPEVRMAAPAAHMVTVLDDTTFTIQHRQPRPEPSTWTVYYPRHLLQDRDPAGFYEWDFWVRPVGNGPFRYGRHVAKTMVQLETNADYYRGRPRIERLVLRFGSRELTELLGGSVDVMHYVDHTAVPKLRDDARFEIYHYLWPDAAWAEAIYWNHRDPIFAHARVRRAFTLALDRAELRAFLALPDDLPIVDVLYTGRQFRRGDLPAPLPYDPNEARRLLDAAGWRDTDGDGIRERNRRSLQFTTIAGPGTLDEQGGAAAVYVQNALRQVGARMELETVETAVVRQRIRRGDFQAAFGRFYMGWVAEGNRRSKWWGADGWTGWEHPRAAALFDSLPMLADPDAVDAVFRELMPIFQRDIPVTLLFPQVQTIVAHRRVRGLESPFRSDPVMAASDLWIKRAR